jgi:hypothetical protein
MRRDVSGFLVGEDELAHEPVAVEVDPYQFAAAIEDGAAGPPPLASVVESN